MGLDIGLNADGAVQRGGHVLGVGHDLTLGLLGSGSGFRGLGSLGGGGSGCGLSGLVLLGAASEGGDHADRQQQCNDLFHLNSPYRMIVEAELLKSIISFYI